MENGRSEDARTLLDLHLADLDGTPNPVLGLVEAQLAVTEGHMGDARTAVEQAYAQFEQSAELKTEKNLHTLAKTLLATGLPGPAEQVALQGIQIDPTNPSLLAIQARALLNGGKSSEALTAASLAATLQPAEIGHMELLLTCLETSQEWPAALEVRQQLLKLRASQPTSADLHALAGCALHSHKPEQAITAVEEALELDAQDGIAYALYGAALMQQDQVEACLSHFSTATELAPHKAEPLVALQMLSGGNVLPGPTNPRPAADRPTPPMNWLEKSLNNVRHISVGK